MLPISETTHQDVASDRVRRLSPRDPRLASWRAFLTAHALISRRLDDDLRTEQELTLAEYVALLQLHRRRPIAGSGSSSWPTGSSSAGAG